MRAAPSIRSIRTGDQPVSSSPSSPSARPTTAVFMRAVLPSIDESQILCCPSCGKATVPVPDPQRTPGVSHCYRCDAEYSIGMCGRCGAAAMILPEVGAGEHICSECGI